LPGSNKSDMAFELIQRANPAALGQIVEMMAGYGLVRPMPTPDPLFPAERELIEDCSTPTEAEQLQIVSQRESKPPTRGASDSGPGQSLQPTLLGRQSARVDAPDPTSVFVIHGRNADACAEMGIFLRACGLKPINFGDLRAEMGGTPTIDRIVEAGMARAQGVVALFTPDEYAALRPSLRAKDDRGDAIARWQARPNVIFEAGMAFGKDRDRVVFVVLG
jgi:hypothetical protein